MKNIEVINSFNLGRLEEMKCDLAETYKIAFAGSPWFEVSKCAEEGCEVGFCKDQPGDSCSSCLSGLVEAYNSQELTAAWLAMIADEDAMMEIETEADTPVRATIARPTTPGELFQRKYKDNQTVRPWLSQNLPDQLVWIEDTFANRDLRLNGNLKNRGQTLVRIAAAYGGQAIYTRTIAPQVVAATLRDVSDCQVFVGKDNKEVISGIVQDRQYDKQKPIITIPDWRTLIAINGLGRQS